MHDSKLGGSGREIADLSRVTALQTVAAPALVGEHVWGCVVFKDTMEKAARWTVRVQSTGRLQTPQRSDPIF
jgi:hypothetical protein